MEYAVNLTAADECDSRLRDLWTVFDRFAPDPPMGSLGHPPHVTLGVYEEISDAEAYRALETVFANASAVRLRFAALKCFEEPGFVIWAAPDPSSELMGLHAAVHATLDPGRCHEHYLPGNWVPHATLAIGIPEDRRAKARALARQPIEPFEVTFDAADCSAFFPVRTIVRRRLRPAL